MKQITEIENIIKLLTEEPDMVPNPPGTEGEPTTMELTDFEKLLGVIKGNLSSEVFDDDYNRWEDNVVREVDDEFIYIDIEKGKPGGRHGNEVAAELFGMEDWDFDIVKDMVENNYDPHYYDPFACDSADEEWNEGYAASALNDKNQRLLETYFSYVSPILGAEITKVISNATHGEDWGDVAHKMQTNVMGNTLVDELLGDYCSTINPAMVNATAKDVRKEWDDILKKMGATDWFDTDEILTFTIPLKQMIYTYYKQNRQKNGDTLEEMVSYVIEDIGSAFGHLNDWWWESDYYEEFEEEYNRDATFTINRFIEKIEEDDIQKLDKIREISDKLTEAGIEVGETINPKGAPYEINVMQLDIKDLKLRVSVRPNRASRESGVNNWGSYKVISMDVDDLLKKINNPELTSADENEEYMSMTYEQVQRLNENKLTETDRDVEVNKFVKFCKDELDINELPPVTLRYDKNKGENHSAIDTTAYQSKDQGVHVYVKDRALVDVLRSLAHELVHHHQLERDEDYYWKHIEDNPGIQSGTDLEDEANARAGSLIKDWGLVHGNKQIYEGYVMEDLTYWGYDGEKIGPIDEDDNLNDLIYREKPKKKHIKRMEKDWGELTGFPIQKFMNIPPPENESDETGEELEYLDSILVDDNFVESADDVDQHFKNYLKSKDLDFPLDLIKKYMAGVRSIILKLKYHYNRPRPGQVADAKGMDFDRESLKSASTPSYPSGHATQGRFIGKLLGDVYPEHKEQLLKIGDDIAYSRNMAKVHYPSDSKIGQKLGDELYKHISKGVKLNEQIGRQDFECLCCCPPGLPGGNSTEVLGNPTMWDLGLTHPVINLQCVLGLNWDTHISMDGYNPTNPQEVQDYIDDNGIQIPSCEDCCMNTGSGCTEAPCTETEDDDTGDDYYDYHDHDLEVDFGDYKPPKPTALDPNYYYQKNKKRKLKEEVEFEPLTKQEVTILNLISKKFDNLELTDIADMDQTQIPQDLHSRYSNLIKLFGIRDTSQAEAWEYGRIYAKWIVDNWDGHTGTIDAPDFSGFLTKNAIKTYPEEYEIEGNEDVWEKAFRQGYLNMWGFDEESVGEAANQAWWEYDVDMETVDWGDSDTENFEIGDVDSSGRVLRLQEQVIDVSEISEEDLSPKLEVGDRVYGWDLRSDGNNEDYHQDTPDQVLGKVVSVEEDKTLPHPFYTGKPNIYYDIETVEGENVAIYPFDKYIKLPKKQLNEQETEDLESQVFRFIRPIDIEKALSQKEIQKVLRSLGLKYDMFDTLNIDLESDMVEDLRNQIRFDNFYKRMIAASDIRGGTWEGLFAGLFNGKVVAGQSGVGKADVNTPEGGWSLKFVGNKNESPTLGSLKTQLQKVKEEGLVPEDATIYQIFNTPDAQTTPELFEAKHQILDSAFENVDFIAVAYPIPDMNVIIMHFTDMDNLKGMLIDSENPPVVKPKSGPEALGELRLSTRGWKSFPFLQITFPETTPEKYETYLKKYPREKEIEGVFGKYGEKIPPEVLQYLRKNPKSVINRLQNIPGYDKYFTEEFISSAEYLTQNANDRIKSFKKFLNERCDMKEIPRTIGFQPREAWEDGLQDIFGRCWFHSTPKGIEGAFGNLADKTFELFPQDEYPEIKEKVDDIFKTSQQVYKYLFPPKDEELKYSLRNVVQADAAEILYNDVKELVEEAEKVETVVSRATEQEHLEYLEGIRNRTELILNIFTSSVGNPVKRSLGFRTPSK